MGPQTSPSGKYKFDGYDVFDKNDKRIIKLPKDEATIHHSYFVRNNQEWLQAGSLYKPLFINLDTKEIFPKERKSVDHFCWAECYISDDGNTLAVDGCIWACPYEYRFYDFSDPSKGAIPLNLDKPIYIQDHYPGIKWDAKWEENIFVVKVFREYNTKDINNVAKSYKVKRKDDKMIRSKKKILLEK